MEKKAALAFSMPGSFSHLHYSAPFNQLQDLLKKKFNVLLFSFDKISFAAARGFYAFEYSPICTKGKVEFL